MPLTLDLAQTVVIGRFNPYIVTPAWLVAEGVCPESEADDPLEPDDSDDGPSTRAFDLGGYEWEVGFGRLAVSAWEPARDCGRPAAAVLDKLTHTPVEAVGHNFTFVCGSLTWGSRPMPQLSGASHSDRRPVETRWVGLYREADGERVEVELTAVPNEVVVVRLNFDRRVPDGKSARDAARRFPTDYARAGRLIQELFQIDVP